MLSAETPYVDLARRFGVGIGTIPREDEATLAAGNFRDSATFAAIVSFKPDILIVDQFWMTIDTFVRELPGKKVLLTLQMDLSIFHIRTPQREFRFRSEDYDLLIRTEPGYETPFDSIEIQPMIIRNRDEIKSREAALAELGLSGAAQACLFSCSGEENQIAAIWKSFSYLQDEGWEVVRSQHRSGGLFPAIDWYDAFQLIICGAGYSAFWEARWMRKEAFFVPFKRRFEDQARRPALFSDYEFDTNGADELIKLIAGL